MSKVSGPGESCDAGVVYVDVGGHGYTPISDQLAGLGAAFEEEVHGIIENFGIGDVNSQAKGSGARFNAGKPDFSLIPMATLEDEARVWMYGRQKYAAWNWTKGMPWSVPFACAMRHMAAWQRGEECDPESGLPHLAHAMCNLRMLTLYATNFPQGDDRPTKELQP
ncbi:MAG TPA: dATP/dGTP diphosphohydrolase domain-containing protein [Telluria sp.]